MDPDINPLYFFPDMALVLLLHHHNCHRRRHCCPANFFLFAAVLLLLASAIAARRATINETGLPTRRRLCGPGSSPPTCRLKCGSCAPCTAVHVPIQPGVSFPLEYYPEAWRCRCGNSLYMP